MEKNSVDIFKKLIPIQGDVSEENLGISPADRAKLIDVINVVIHSAATLDFHESLKPTVNTNLLGTRRIMELSNQMKNLKAVVHVSSAYVNSYLVECEEILYPAPELAEKVIDLTTSLTDEALLELQPKLLKEHPNAYTFTKHLAEHEVNKLAHKIPCGIVRPSMSKYCHFFKNHSLYFILFIPFFSLFLFFFSCFLFLYFSLFSDILILLF